MAWACARARAARGAVHTAARRSRGPHAGTAVARAGCPRARVGPSRADALPGEPRRVGRRGGQPRLHARFPRFALVPQTVPDQEAPGDRQARGLLGQPGRQGLLGQLGHPCDAAACPGRTRQDGRHPADMGGGLPDHRRPCA